MQKVCRLLKNNQQVNFTEEKEGEGSLFYACQHVSEKNDTWFLDSGCSNHMTSELRNLYCHRHLIQLQSEDGKWCCGGC